MEIGHTLTTLNIFTNHLELSEGNFITVQICLCNFKNTSFETVRCNFCPPPPPRPTDQEERHPRRQPGERSEAGSNIWERQQTPVLLTFWLRLHDGRGDDLHAVGQLLLLLASDHGVGVIPVLCFWPDGLLFDGCHVRVV